MESWRKELYASDYGSKYLMHYRTKGSKNGISRTAGYRAIGQLAGQGVGLEKSKVAGKEGLFSKIGNLTKGTEAKEKAAKKAALKGEADSLYNKAQVLEKQSREQLKETSAATEEYHGVINNIKEMARVEANPAGDRRVSRETGVIAKARLVEARKRYDEARNKQDSIDRDLFNTISDWCEKTKELESMK